MTDKKIPEWLKLKDNHPTMVKLMKMYELAEELGITISFMGHATIVEDRDRDRSMPHLRLEDIEQDHSPPSEWPPSTEFKVIYQNPAYLAEQERVNNERRAVMAEEQKKKAETKVAREKAEQEARRLAQEKVERAELARLKNKFGE